MRTCDECGYTTETMPEGSWCPNDRNGADCMGTLTAAEFHRTLQLADEIVQEIIAEETSEDLD